MGVQPDNLLHLDAVGTERSEHIRNQAAGELPNVGGRPPGRVRKDEAAAARGRTPPESKFLYILILL